MKEIVLWKINACTKEVRAERKANRKRFRPHDDVADVCEIVLILAEYTKLNVASHISISRGELTTEPLKKQPFCRMQALPYPRQLCDRNPLPALSWLRGQWVLIYDFSDMYTPPRQKKQFEKNMAFSVNILDKIGIIPYL